MDLVEAAIQKAKHPFPWLSFGADARLREEYFNNAITLNSKTANHEYNFQRYRERVWTTITPFENLDVNARLIYEPRHYCKPDNKPDWANNEALFDKLNVTYKQAFGLPMTLVAGRQDILLGDGWLVFEGTPEDGSRTVFFDAIRDTIHFKDANTTVDLIYIDQAASANRYIQPFCNKDVPLRSDDERGAIVYVSNKSLARTTWDGYFIYKNDSIPSWKYPGVVSDSAELYTFGTRVEHDFDQHWRARGEIAEQLGHKNGRDVMAMGANSRLTYFFRDKLDNQLRTGYEFLSGDDPRTGKDEQFNLVWGRWPQWSELLVYTWIKETRVADVTNLHRVYTGWTFKPIKPLEFSTDYHLLFADENTLRDNANFSNEGLFRGQLLTALLKYKFNEHVAGHLIGEMFVPGNYYSKLAQDTAFYARYEIVFTW